jgi:hypothetical protein
MMMFPTGMETTFGSGAEDARRGRTPREQRVHRVADPPRLPLRHAAHRRRLPPAGLDLDGDETEDEPAANAAPEEGFDDLMGFLKDASRSWDLDLDEPDDAPGTATTLSDDDLAHVGRRAAASRPALGTPMSPPWAEPGEVVTHLFPTGAPVFGPRYRGRLVHAESGLALVDLPLPPDEQDPFGWAAGLAAGASVAPATACSGRRWRRAPVAPTSTRVAAPDREPPVAARRDTARA